MRVAGFTVLPGNVYPLTDCSVLISVFGTCFGNNPSSFYTIIQPPSVNSFVDPYYAQPFEQQIPLPGNSASNCRQPGECIKVNQFYQFSDNQATLTIISMPPQAAYFGYQSNVFTEYVGNDGTSPDPSRTQVFGSIGNAINSQVIQNQTGNSAFGTDAGNGPQLAFITTPSSTLDQSLRVLFSSIPRANADLLFTEPVWSKNNQQDPGMVVTGLDQAADDWWTWIRYTLPNPQYSSNAQAWFDNIQQYVRVYKISLPSSSENELFGPVSYTVKEATSETQYTAALGELSHLLASYLADQETTTVTTSAFRVSESTDASGVPAQGLVGQLCIENQENCVGTSEDTDAYRLSPTFNLDAGKSLFVAGVDHTATANAVYVNIAVNDDNVQEGVASLFQVSDAAGFTSGTITGSAASALKNLGLSSQASNNLQNELPYLYVIMLTRNACPTNWTFCNQVGAVLPTGVPYADDLLLIERAYLKPGTTTGGNPNVMLNPIMIR